VIECRRMLEHASAEINTACREGFYVHMLPPILDFGDAKVELELDENNQVIGVKEIHYPRPDFRLQYQIVKIDPRRESAVDHRTALEQLRNPDYQPFGGIS